MKKIKIDEWLKYSFFNIFDKIQYFSSLSANRKLMKEEVDKTINAINSHIQFMKDIDYDTFHKCINKDFYRACFPMTQLYKMLGLTDYEELFNKLTLNKLNEDEIKNNFNMIINGIVIALLHKKQPYFEPHSILYDKSLKITSSINILETIISNPKIKKNTLKKIERSGLIVNESAYVKCLKSKKNLYKGINYFVLESTESSLRSIFSEYEKQDLFNQGRFLTGNAIYCAFKNKKINDHDYFFYKKETVIDFMNYIYKKNEIKLKDLKSCDGNLEYKDTENGISFFIDNEKGFINQRVLIGSREIIIVITENAISFPEYKVQLIFRVVGSIKDVIKTFDYEHCKASITFYDKKAHISYLTYMAINENELVLSKNVYNPLGALLRYSKFVKKYDMNANEQLIIALAIAINEYKHDAKKMTQDINFYGKHYVLDEFKDKPLTYENFIKVLSKKFVILHDNCKDINAIHKKKIEDINFSKKVSDFF